METWNNLIDKFDFFLEKLKLGNTVKIASKEISPVVMGFALIIICIPIWGYLEIEGKNKLIGAVVVILMAWGVAQLGALGLGDGVGENLAISRQTRPLHLGICANLTKTQRAQAKLNQINKN